MGLATISSHSPFTIQHSPFVHQPIWTPASGIDIACGMETLTIYHNPRCSKSRAALALLQERQVPLQVVEYLKNPPTRAELAALRRKLGAAPSAWVRTGEAEFK